jgi:hypothetical protein
LYYYTFKPSPPAAIFVWQTIVSCGLPTAARILAAYPTFGCGYAALWGRFAIIAVQIGAERT